MLRALGSVPGVGSLLQVGVPVQVPLVIATAVAAGVAWRLGHRWAALQDAMIRGIALALGAVLILLVVGMLIGVWIAGGVVPLMIETGLRLLSAGAFLPAACVICAVVSVVTGSSWTAAGTVGIALIGVGDGLGFGAPMTAGAVISGAYFGDKMSPLSDTTNLAAVISGVELFAHVRHMMWISVPSMVMAVGMFAVLGWRQGGVGAEVGEVEAMQAGLGAAYLLTAWLWVVPVTVLGLVVGRVPALPALVAGVGLGGGAAVWVQGVSMGEVWVVAYEGVTAATGIEALDALLSRGGMSSMYGTVSLILCAMCFGGVMELSGSLERLATAVLGMVRGSRGGLVAATVGTSAGMNVVASDQYLSLVVPGRMYRPAYARAGLHEKNLSRALEDGGTLTSPFVPWNTCGAYMAATLGVFPLAYLPFAFFNLINPVFSIVVGYLGWTMTAATKETVKSADAAGGGDADTDAGNKNEKGSTRVVT